MRLDKFIASAFNIPRKQAHEYILKGMIKVNNNSTHKKDLHINEDRDEIYFNDELITYHKFIYIMLNKPKNTISAVKDKVDVTVVDLIKERKDIFPVGRLDKDTEGLLLLTNNGKLAHRLTSPNYHVNKKYYVVTKEKIKDTDIKQFQEGLQILDGNNHYFYTKPALLEKIDDNTCYVTISEGKYHQIKNMFKKVDNEVEYLKRVAVGNLKLDENLKIGAYRYLTDNEINEIKKQCMFFD